MSSNKKLILAKKCILVNNLSIAVAVNYNAGTVLAALFFGWWREWSWGVLHGVCWPWCVGLGAQLCISPAVQHIKL